jgi:tRNA(Ile)-lysidine synthase
MSLDPARAAVRLAVRRVLPSRDGATVLVACSGGADSLALLAATVFEARRVPVRVVGVVVDHGLQDDSAPHTEAVVAQMAALGADETASIRVTVDPGPAGVEAGAREARYAALAELASHFGADAVLLGHTLDDQAETVLLGLTRGAGARSLRGMRRSFREDGGVLFLRPLLDLTREQTEAACRADGLAWWDDPHNTDPRFTRARIRHTVMPVLERELGPGVAAALARTADLVREESEVVDTEVDRALQRWYDGSAIDLVALGSEPAAVRTRVLRHAAIASGAIASELTRAHVLALVALRPGKEVQLPGHLTAYRDGPLLRFRPTGPVP